MLYFAYFKQHFVMLRMHKNYPQMQENYPQMQEMAFPRLQIAKFSGGACPRIPLEGSCIFGARTDSEVTIA